MMGGKGLPALFLWGFFFEKSQDFEKSRDFEKRRAFEKKTRF